MLTFADTDPQGSQRGYEKKKKMCGGNKSMELNIWNIHSLQINFQEKPRKNEQKSWLLHTHEGCNLQIRVEGELSLGTEDWVGQRFQ